MGLNAGYYLRPSDMARASHTKQDKREEKGRGQIMASYTTIGELIEHLKGEDSNAPIIYQYYLAEHFEVSEEVFGQVAKEFDSIIPCLDNSHLAIEEEIDSKREEVNV